MTLLPIRAARALSLVALFATTLTLFGNTSADARLLKSRRVMAEPALTVETLLSWKAHTSPTDTPKIRRALITCNVRNI